jgi:hypothetical protein
MHFGRFTPFATGPVGFQSGTFAVGFGFVDAAD